MIKNKVNIMKFSEPTFDYHTKNVSVCLILDLESIVDSYSYHDFPSQEWLFLRKNDLIKLRDIAERLVKKIEEMESKNDTESN